MTHRRFITGFLLVMIVCVMALDPVIAQPPEKDWVSHNSVVEQLLHFRDLNRKEILGGPLKGHKIQKLNGPILLGKTKGKIIIDIDRNTHYSFLKGKPVLIIQSNGEGQVDSTGVSLARIMTALGRCDTIRPFRVVHGAKECLYVDEGISFVQGYDEPFPEIIRIFQPTTIEEYKKWLWDKPGEMGSSPAR